MAIKLELDTWLAEKILRADILQNLSYDGVSAIIDFYDDMGEDIDFDQSLFWCFHRYESALAAVMDHDSSEVDAIVRDIKEENPDEEVSQDDVEYECKHWLMEHTTCIPMNDGSVIINTEF
jgi:hypothetical protein